VAGQPGAAAAGPGAGSSTTSTARNEPARKSLFNSVRSLTAGGTADCNARTVILNTGWAGAFAGGVMRGPSRASVSENCAA
jgi:hypothetical protein